MTSPAMSNVSYLREFQRSPQSAATKQNLTPEVRVTAGTAQSLIMVEPTWEKTVWARLERLVSLPEGWDGTDAKQLNGFASQFGMKLLQAYLPPTALAPQLSLLRYGGLQFEWFTEKFEFEIEIVGPYRFKAWLNDLVNEEEFEGSFEYDHTKLSQMFQRMFQLNLLEIDEATAA
jgi:hypothetical protein